MRILAASAIMKCRQVQYNRKTVLAGLVVCIVMFGLIWRVYNDYSRKLKDAFDSAMAMHWEGFGPERGLYNFTVVTAMVDIGRGSWDTQTRTYNTYLLYMQRVLRLDVNMVVFVDKKGKPFIDWMRRGRESHTHIIILDFKDFPYYKLKDRIQEIMDSVEYQENNELVKKHLCESYVPEYDILQLSKLYLMDRAARENFFNTSYLMWIDGGYGHGEDVHPHDGIWIPKNLFGYPNQITFIERDPGAKFYEDQKDNLHKISINIIAGLFFGGGNEAFKEIYKMQTEQVSEWMEKGIIDDDQTMYMLLYYKKPSLFHLVSGDWFDVFNLFNTQNNR